MNLTDRAFDASVTLDTKLKRFQKGSILVVISLVLGGIAWLDRVTNELPVHHLYYLPIILAVVRFGWRGGWLTALAATLLYHTANDHLLTWQYAGRDVMRLSIFLGIAGVTARLVADSREMRRLALTDDLTGLHNLRSFEAHYAALCRTAMQASTPLTLLMLDLDRLKALNDQYGHLAGAQAIQALGRVLTQQLPAEAIACRYGGDEFIVALPAWTAPQALALAERIRQALVQLAPVLAGNALPAGTLSTSIGAATLSPAPQARAADFSETLFRAADQALYQAKAKGRNYVCSSSPEPLVVTTDLNACATVS